MGGWGLSGKRKPRSGLNVNSVYDRRNPCTKMLAKIQASWKPPSARWKTACFLGLPLSEDSVKIFYCINFRISILATFLLNMHIVNKLCWLWPWFSLKNQSCANFGCDIVFSELYSGFSLELSHEAAFEPRQCLRPAGQGKLSHNPL